jgi:hypothetical protein
MISAPDPTPEEQAAQVEHNMQLALASQAAFPEQQNPTPEQQNALVAHNMQLAQASQTGGFGGADSALDYVASLGGDQTPPPFVGGSIQGGMPGVFSPNDRASALGNVFTMDAYNDQSGNPTVANNPTGNSQFLSTNNWRLLPPQYRDPNYYLYNGRIMDRRLTQATLAPKSILGQESQGDPGYYYAGQFDPGTWKHPFGSFAHDFGYPGQLDTWSTGATPTY